VSDPRRLSIVARATAADLEQLARLVPPAGGELEVLLVPVDDGAALGDGIAAAAVTVPSLGHPPGVAVARAIALARGTWVLLLEAGDRLRDDALDRLLEAPLDAPAVLADTAPADALAALLSEPRALAGSLVSRELVAAVSWSGAGWRDAWELDLWLRLLPRLADARITSPTLRVRAGANRGRAARQERAAALARALDETPPTAWPLVDATGARLGSGGAYRAVARLAATRPEPPLIGVAAALWLRASTFADTETLPPELPPAELIGELPGLTRATPTPCERAGRYAQPTAAAQRLSVVLEVPSLDRGGLESVVADLALALGAEGIRTAVVCTDHGGSEVERLRGAGTEVLVLGSVDRAAELGAWLDGRDVDLLNAHYSEVGLPLAAARGIPVVVTFHNEYAWVPNRPDDPMRRAASWIDAYTAVSASAADFCAERFAIPRERIQVIRNALAIPLREEPPASPDAGRSGARALLGIPEDAELLVQIGRVDPVKSPHVLVDAVVELAAAHPRLVAWIVGPLGDREYATRLRARIAGHGLGERVLVTGRRDDVPRLLAAADVFVLPSWIEGLSLAVLEALAAGVPAVLSRTGDAGFLLGEGDAARVGPLPGALVDRPRIDPVAITPESFHDLVWRDDPERGRVLAAAIAEVLDDLPARREAAHRRAAALAPWLAPERMVHEYADLFRRTVAATAERSASFLEASVAAVERSRADAELATESLRHAVIGLLRADRALTAERRQRAAAHHAIGDLSREVQRVTAALAPAKARLEQSLEKLRIGKRVRAAARAVLRRGAEGP
jgi:glycosyltransferase involved in cell wall biosynthesis